tara:strand:- start:218 stop:466 length:249 start_codon:yes stop_codon:yes gene_type:complete
VKITKKYLEKMIREEIESFRDPIDPMDQEKNKEDLINDLRDNLISCLHRIEVEQKIDYELVMLIDNALERAKTITGKEPFQP